MKALLKKSVPVLFVVSSVAVAAGLISKEAVNQKVAALVAPYNNDKTKMEIKFTDLNIDAVRALDFGAQAEVIMKGTKRNLKLQFKNLAYHYGDGKNPVVTGKVNAEINVADVFGQKTLNEMGSNVPQMIQGFSSSFTERYGDAVTVHAVAEDLKKDAQGNFVSVRVRLSAFIDYAKLPASVKMEDVEYKSLEANLTLGQKGLGASVKIVMNPQASTFGPSEPGLKEYINNLLSGDEATYQSLKSMADMLDITAMSLVDSATPTETEQ